MPKLIILGTSNAVPTEGHENTHMVLVGSDRMVLIDCGSNPIVRLQTAGLDPAHLTDVVLTHFHPDHVSGFPLLVLSLWLMGRRSPLRVVGLEFTLERMRGLLDMYGWFQWPDVFTLDFVELPAVERAPVLESDGLRMYSSPVRHVIPTIGLRAEFPETGRSMAYSCDTSPCDEVVRLAAGVDLLLHEAAGSGSGHSSAEEAGDIAARAEVGSLVLIHFPTGGSGTMGLVEAAQSRFQGPVSLARDLMTLDF
jgi:ribonuclease Z